MGPLFVMLFWAVLLFVLIAAGCVTLPIVEKRPPTPLRVTIFAAGALLGLYCSFMVGLMIVPYFLQLPGVANTLVVALGTLLSGYLAVRCYDNTTRTGQQRH